MRRVPLAVFALLLAPVLAAAGDDGLGDVKVDFSPARAWRGRAPDAAPAPAAQGSDARMRVAAPVPKPAFACSPTPPPSRYSGPRKGLGIAPSEGHGGAPVAAKVLDELGARWYYTWSIDRISGANSPFIPMAISAGQGPAAAAAAAAEQAPAVLGYNEPDIGWHGGVDRPKVPLEEALGPGGWTAFTNAVPRTIAVGGPAVAMNKGDWMPRFMATGPRVDFTAMHWYGPPDAARFIAAVKQAYASYCRPVWITEFGVMDQSASDFNDADVENARRLGMKVYMNHGRDPSRKPDGTKAPGNDRPNSHTVAQTKEFMSQALAWLDGEGKDYVQRYAWFTPPPYKMPGSTAPDALWYLDPTGKVRLTELGEVYSRAR